MGQIAKHFKLVILGLGCQLGQDVRGYWRNGLEVETSMDHNQLFQ